MTKRTTATATATATSRTHSLFFSILLLVLSLLAIGSQGLIYKKYKNNHLYAHTNIFSPPFSPLPSNTETLLSTRTLAPSHTPFLSSRKAQM